MLSKNSGNEKNNASGDSYNVQLLRDIKEISSALSLHKAAPKALLSSSHVRSKSAGKTRPPVSRPNPNSKTVGDTSLQKNKKSSLAWNWKKPLRAITHFRQHRYDICFHLHVHSIEGLPSNLNDSSLVVQWKRKDEVLSTRPCIVLDGAAEFEETLMHRCTVYCSKSGPYHSAKYEVKLFLIYASVADAPRLDLGKHWIDLTRLLPLSLDELEGERSTRKWTTSFKLSGAARGAVLNLSFDYSVIKDSNSDVNGASNSSSRSTMLRRVGSVPSNLDHRSSPLDEGKVFHQVSPNLSLELSKSIDFLYEKLNEQNLESSMGKDTLYECLGKTSLNPGLESAKQTDESDDTEFAFIDKGVEIVEQEGSRSKLDESTLSNTDSSRIEIIDVDDILKDEDAALTEETRFIDQLLMASPENEGSSLSSKQSFFGESDSAVSSHVVSESFDVESSSAMDDSLEQENFLEVKSSYKATKMSMKSLSLDDITESVASDFLNMLEFEDCSYIYTSDGEPASPRECLLREFEREALASGGFFLDFDGEAEYAYEIDDEDKDFSFTSSTEGVDENIGKDKAELLINRRKAKVLENLETETLMREWGLNENIFRNSSRVRSDGFGSPIELPVDERIDLPPLGDNLGPFVQTKGGGYIRSMNPLQLRKSKNVARLIMQVSAPVVLASELGSDVIEILQSIVSSGISGLCSQVNALMPLEDITGKTIHEVAEDSAPERVMHDCSDNSRAALDRNSSDQLGSFHSEEKFGSCRSHMISGYAPLEALAALAMDRIESLSIEGLRIQCGMSDQDAPSSIEPKLMDASGASELIGFCFTLNEWLKLDTGFTNDGGQMSDEKIKILSAHHADQQRASSGKHHILGNELTLGVRVMLRDPFRNYEPVGPTMLALIQVERPSDSSNPCLYRLAEYQSNEEASELDWGITEISLVGLKTESGVDHPWGTKTQQQSGARWLLASGMGKPVKLPSSKSKAIIVSNPQASSKPQDTLWSITTSSHDQESNSSSCSASALFTRNPDVNFPNERTSRP
ncbi:PREDICTED: protein PLASTID MOVEMENT IMPAIRED 1-RELATED 2 [Tarenaya hassleriana]|uniref:protein PLASTID MOVEMENT IMPAIRED 1-RELATED 2 n=1 Tax=Tarenaya hassleriana TaxID=28532 RepID=UPI00053C13B5|nr:PREDICTED: protein PLASTID MOVEMENT IMPAIRED 1-RELATED 2 [Tarenaya hassleriana]XP_010536181.1 PREDICTED: protein PLASTID MOVEMENT IMPAIRED 1-RELATED 2 [Tarenaya hassleriana]